MDIAGAATYVLEPPPGRAPRPAETAPGGAGGIRITMTFAGRGTLRPGALALSGAVRHRISSPPPGRTVERRFRAIVAGGRAWVRGRRRWTEVAAPAGPFGPVLLDGDGVVAVLRAAGERIDDLGVEEVDGVRARLYEFEVRGAAIGAPPGAGPGLFSARAWIGTGDGLLRRMTLRSAGGGGPSEPESWRAEVEITLSRFGAGGQVEPPAPDEVAGRLPVPEGAELYAFPFGLAPAGP